MSFDEKPVVPKSIAITFQGGFVDPDVLSMLYPPKISWWSRAPHPRPSRHWLSPRSIQKMPIASKYSTCQIRPSVFERWRLSLKRALISSDESPYTICKSLDEDDDEKGSLSASGEWNWLLQLRLRSSQLSTMLVDIKIQGTQIMVILEWNNYTYGDKLAIIVDRRRIQSRGPS